LLTIFGAGPGNGVEAVVPVIAVDRLGGESQSDYYEDSDFPKYA
jgi:hypothetical protein